MHPNAAFRWNDEAELRVFVAARGFATLCVVAEGPMVAHMPLVVTEAGTLRFHLAKANPVARHLDGAIAVASLTDADFYVSPDWYETKDQVPTWNYLAVEIEGQVHTLNEEGLIAQLEALSDAFETRLAPKPVWTREKMTPDRFEAMLGSIRGFELVPSAWRGTCKMGQNKKPAERAALANALATLGLDREAGMVPGA